MHRLRIIPLLFVVLFSSSCSAEYYETKAIKEFAESYYKDAEKYLSQGDYYSAYRYYSYIVDDSSYSKYYPDAKEKAQESLYIGAKEKMDNGDYKEAVDYFEKIKSYKDSMKLGEECAGEVVLSCFKKHSILGDVKLFEINDVSHGAVSLWHVGIECEKFDELSNEDKIKYLSYDLPTGYILEYIKDDLGTYTYSHYIERNANRDCIFLNDECIAMFTQYKTGKKGNGSGSCPLCGGWGAVKYYYGDSALEAALNGYDDWSWGPCPKCKK